jgi:hypothetical protein
VSTSPTEKEFVMGIEETCGHGTASSSSWHWQAHFLAFGWIVASMCLDIVGCCLPDKTQATVEQLALKRYEQKINEGRWQLVERANADRALNREQIHRMQLVYEQTFDPARLQREGVGIRRVTHVVMINDTYCCRGVVKKRYALSHEFCCEIDSDIAVSENEYLRANWKRIQSQDLLQLSGEKTKPDDPALPIQLEDD